MKFYFWQNIISPHQIDLLAELSKKHEVTLVVSKKIDSYRSKQNWHAPVPERVELLVDPTFLQVWKLIKTTRLTDIHVISGFMAYSLPNLALILCTFLKKRVYIYSESVDWFSFKGRCKLFIRSMLCRFLRHHISGVLAIGEKGVQYFKNLGFCSNKIYEFGYFIKPPCLVYSEDHNKTSVKNILFVGRLVKYKGLPQFLNIYSKLSAIESDYSLTVIGDGDQRPNIEKLVSKLGLANVKLLGDIPRNQVFKNMAEADILVLPNISEEGWGAVVNEALLSGLPVICTPHTGSKGIIKQGVQGFTVDINAPDKWLRCIKAAVELDNNIVKARAYKTITPVIAAQYFLDIVNNPGDDTLPPWKRELL